MKKVKMFSVSLALMLITFATVAFASSFTSTFDFDSNLKGGTRTYTGTNMNISATSMSVGGIQRGLSTTYTVSLYRSKTWSNDYIGVKSFPRDSAGSAVWSNVGAGDYYFSFSKTIDGVWLKSTDVKMFN